MTEYTPPPGYTPSDDEVKDDFLNMGVIRYEENAETLDRWHRWLAAHDRLVAANAWAEGYGQGARDNERDMEPADNPYLNGDNK